MEEVRIDLRNQNPEEIQEAVRATQLNFKLNHTMPYTDEYNALVRELIIN